MWIKSATFLSEGTTGSSIESCATNRFRGKADHGCSPRFTSGHWRFERLQHSFCAWGHGFQDELMSEREEKKTKNSHIAIRPDVAVAVAVALAAAAVAAVRHQH